MKPRSTRSFTLIEMLIVIVIIGILAAALIPRLQSVQLRARNVQRKADLRTIGQSIMIYYNNYGDFPVRLWHLVTWNVLISIPTDPAVATNEVCGAYFTDFNAIYLASWFYNASNCSSDPVSCSTLHNGYLYAQSQGLDYATLGARMENDGTINSYDNPTMYTWIQKLCNREGDLSAYENNNYNVWWLAIADFQEWLDAKGKVLFNFFHKWDYLY